MKAVMGLLGVVSFGDSKEYKGAQPSLCPMVVLSMLFLLLRPAYRLSPSTARISDEGPVD